MVRRGCERFIRDVTRLEELSEPVRAAVEEQFAPELPWLALFIPPQDYPVQRMGWLRELPFGWRRTPPRTLAFGDERIVIIEDLGGAPRTIVVPLLNLIQMDIVTELLYSYIDLVWTAEDEAQHLRIEFNGVSLYLLERGLNWARAEIAVRTALPALTHPTETLPEWLPFKFRNYLAISLLPGERVETVVFQPGIRKPSTRWPVYVTPDRAFALTNAHLIIVQDARRTRQADTRAYWIERHYIMRRQALRLTLEAQGTEVRHVLATGRTGAGPERSWLLGDPQGAALFAGMTTWLLHDDPLMVPAAGQYESV